MRQIDLQLLGVQVREDRGVLVEDRELGEDQSLDGRLLG